MWILLMVLWLMPLALVWAEDLCRVHEWPDGTVSVTCPAETPPDKAGLPFVDIPKSTYKTMDRAKRHAWRLQKNVLVVDDTVPYISAPVSPGSLADLKVRIEALEAK